MQRWTRIGDYALIDDLFEPSALRGQRAQAMLGFIRDDSIEAQDLRRFLWELGHFDIHRMRHEQVLSTLEHCLSTGVVGVLPWARMQGMLFTAGSSGGKTQPNANVGGSVRSAQGSGKPPPSARRGSASPSGAGNPSPPAPKSSGSAATEAMVPIARQSASGAAVPKKVDPWLRDVLKIMCPKDKAFLDDLRARGVKIKAYDRIYFDDPYYDGTKWTTKRFEAGGTTSGKSINMIRSSSAKENAATIYHEGVHTGQPDTMPWRDKEYDAYVSEDRWRIAHGLPPHDTAFRTKDALGNQVTDEKAIKAFVDKEYPGVTASPSSGVAPDQVIGKTKSGKTIAQRADGSTYTRDPVRGDSYAGPEVTVPRGGVPVDMSQLKCP